MYLIQLSDIFTTARLKRFESRFKNNLGKFFAEHNKPNRRMKEKCCIHSDLDIKLVVTKEDNDSIPLINVCQYINR